MKLLRVFILSGFLIIHCLAMAQVKIGENSAPDASAMLELKSTTTGFLPPRVALTAINAAGPIASPAKGLMVYNTATAGTAPYDVSPGYYSWNGTLWLAFVAKSPLVYSCTGVTANIDVPVTSAVTNYTIPNFSFTAVTPGLYKFETSLLVQRIDLTQSENTLLSIRMTRAGSNVNQWFKSQLNLNPNFDWNDYTYVGDQIISLWAGDTIDAVFSVYGPLTGTLTKGTIIFRIPVNNDSDRSYFNVLKLY